MVNHEISHRLTILFLLTGSIVSIPILSSHFNSVAFSTTKLPVVNPIVGTGTSHYLSTINANSENGVKNFTISELGQSIILSNPDTSDPLFPVNSSPYGINLKKWAISYLQKDMSEYNENFPKNDDKCNTYNNSGPVKMLANPFDLVATEEAERVNILDFGTINVAEHRKVSYECNFVTSDSYFFTMFLESCDYHDPKSDTDAELNACVVKRNQEATGKAWLDGVELQNLDRYRLTTDYFTINYTTPNPDNVKEGTYRALLNGLFLFVKPLPPGDHELKYVMSQITKNPQDINYSAEIIYKLHITEKA